MKAKFEQQQFHQFLTKMMEQLNPNEFDYEKNFQNELASQLGEYFEEKMEVRTHALEKNRKFSCVDLVVRIGNMFVPIELKYRREDQNTAGYAEDYIDDIVRIRKMLIDFDDIPFGYAICLTDDEGLIEKCWANEFAYNYENHLYYYHQMLRINWKGINNDEFAYGIAGWRWGGVKMPKTGKLFLDDWNKKEEDK